MSLFSKLVPREVKFFELFDQTAGKIHEGLDEFIEVLNDPSSMEERSRKLKAIEHETDEIVHGTIDLLNSTFITPIDREDIQNLVRTMDDVIDLAQGACSRLWLYEVREIHPELPKLASVLSRAFAEAHRAISQMRDMKNVAAIKKHCIEINRLENEGDFIVSAAVANLFKNAPDPLYVMKWKEIFEIIESAIDRCEDVANVVEGIVVKQA
jgi:predicted phosphate transport protein (TIGR00153 family)